MRGPAVGVRNRTGYWKLRGKYRYCRCKVGKIHANDGYNPLVCTPVRRRILDWPISNDRDYFSKTKTVDVHHLEVIVPFVSTFATHNLTRFLLGPGGHHYSSNVRFEMSFKMNEKLQKHCYWSSLSDCIKTPNHHVARVSTRRI